VAQKELALSLCKLMISLGGVSLPKLAGRFPTDPPPSVLRSFNDAIAGVGLDPKKYTLRYVPSKAVRSVEAKGGFKLDIGSMGLALKWTAYVVHSDSGGRATEREVAIHEAMHFRFGPHPWPKLVEGRYAL